MPTLSPNSPRVILGHQARSLWAGAVRSPLQRLAGAAPKRLLPWILSAPTVTRLQGNVLLIGYGNPGRRDDGLGPALAQAVGRRGLEQVTVESCYQLAIEHAEQVARHDHAIFADAAVGGPEPFRFDPLDSTIDAAFSTHHMAPETILGLARTVFQAATNGYVLAIRGYDFDGFGEALSARARDNLAAAVRFLVAALPTHPCEVRP